MDNLSVNVKLIILNVVALIGLAIIAIFGYNGVMTAKEDMDLMYNRYFHSMYYVANCRYNVRYAQVQSTIGPMSDDAQLFESRSKKYKAAVESFEKNLAGYEAIIAKDPDLIAELAPAKEDWEKFKAASTVTPLWLITKIIVCRMQFQSVKNWRNFKKALCNVPKLCSQRAKKP